MVRTFSVVKKNNIYIKNIQESGLQASNYYDKPNFSGIYLFFSFDIVNSTEYKNINDNWKKIFNKFFESCKYYLKEHTKDSFRYDAKVWKMIGDEILFYLPVFSKEEIYHAPDCAFETLKNCIKILEFESERALGVKGTLWISYVKDYATDENADNIIIKEKEFDHYNLDFLGPDIDIGFRISKFSFNGQLVIDAKLACYITKFGSEIDKKHISENMKIVSWEKLKGVWNNRHYPIVWYNNDWNRINESFQYDTKFYSSIVKNIINKVDIYDTTVLTQVFKDINKKEEIQFLREKITEAQSSTMPYNEKINIPTEKLAEIHFAVICINENREILILKRGNKDFHPGKWEFGCSQLHLNESIHENIKKSYLNDIGVEINFFAGNEFPIGSYEITKEKENNRKIPGLIYIGKITKKDVNINKFNVEKHCEYKWVNEENYLEIDPYDCVADFHKHIKKCIEVYKLIESKE